MHRMALRSLVHDRGRLAAALTGVAFATVLLLVQFGLYEGFREASSELVRRVGGDVWVIARGTSHLDDTEALAAGAAIGARTHPCVRAARAVVVGFAPVRRPTGGLRSLQLIGLDLSMPEGLAPWRFEIGLPHDLRGPDRVSVDRGDLDRLGVLGDAVGTRLEIAGRVVRVAALTRDIRSVSFNPLAFADIRTARELLGLGDDQASYWVLSVRTPACLADVIQRAERDPELRAMTSAQFAGMTEAYALRTSGLGLVLGFVAALGLLVAAVIVGQTLHGHLRQHARELALLKTVGAKPEQLVAFVLWQAGCVTLVGGAVGALLAAAIAYGLPGLPVQVVLTRATLAEGLFVIALVCALASGASVRAVLRIEAAEVLR